MLPCMLRGARVCRRSMAAVAGATVAVFALAMSSACAKGKKDSGGSGSESTAAHGKAHHGHRAALEPPTPVARPKHSASAPLPDPPKADLGDEPRASDECGSVVVDGERVPLDCNDEEVTSATKGAAGEVVPREELQPKDEL